MGDRWQPLPEFIGLAVGTLIVVGLAVGAVLLAQNLGASGELLRPRVANSQCSSLKREPRLSCVDTWLRDFGQTDQINSPTTKAKSASTNAAASHSKTFFNLRISCVGAELPAFQLGL